MTRFCNGRVILVLFLLLVGALALFKNAGVREVRRAVTTREITVKDPEPAPSDWPWWRGLTPGKSPTTSNPPLQWSVSENVVWKAVVPGRGHSSPCLWGDRIFLTTSDAEKQSISLLSFDRETGNNLWQLELHRGGFGECHQKNSHASATPACDGQFVYTANCIKGAIWVSAVDFTGQIAWCREAGPYAAEWGYGSSPAIHKSLVIVAGDNRGSGVDRLVGSSWLAGIHRQTGEIVWRIKRVDGDSFGSPIVAHVADRDQLLLSGKEMVTAYDPISGEVLWKCRWDVKRTANTVAFDDQHVFASAKQPQSEMICIRADGSGDVTETHVVWREKKSACDVPSPCVHDGRLYSLGDDGVLTCLNTADGKVVWKKRLGGNMSASPLISGEHLFCCNEEGTTHVLKISGRGDVVAENALGDCIMASPIVSRDRLYIRTTTQLYCLASNYSAQITDQSEIRPKRF